MTMNVQTNIDHHVQTRQHNLQAASELAGTGYYEEALALATIAAAHTLLALAQALSRWPRP
jgi:hypothetical protein